MANGSDWGRAARRRRLDMGLSRNRVAVTVGVPVSLVGRWERGEEKPDPDHSAALARLLGMETTGPGTGPERASPPPVVSVEILAGGLPAPPSGMTPSERRGLDADPWSTPPERMVPPPRLDRGALVVGRSGRNGAAVTSQVKAPDASPRRRQAPPPGGAANTGTVFPVPDSRTGSERVTYRGEGRVSAGRERFTYRIRFTATIAALVALGLLLWWALGSLDDGFGAVLDLIRGDGGPVPGAPAGA